MDTFRYIIYGLKIESDIEIPEALITEFDTADLTIKEEEIPKDVKEHIKDRSETDFVLIKNASAAFFQVPKVGAYHVTATKIIVERDPAATLRENSCYLLGSALGFLMYLRGIVALHGGAIAFGQQALIITGESGSGKSTVCERLFSRDYQFISDDVCALRSDDTGYNVEFGFPQQKLCRDAALRQGYNLEELIYINEERDKFAIRLKDGYLTTGAHFSYLFELVLTDDEYEFCELNGREKLFAVMRNIFRGNVSRNMWGMKPEFMKQCVNIAASIQVFQIKRPAGQDTLEQILSEIEAVVRS